MATDIRNKPQKDADPWTYIDIMTTAIAYLDEDKLFADTDKWIEAWRDIAGNAVTGPLLTDVHFAKRGGQEVSSDEVEALIRTLSRSTIISLGNPRFLYFSVDPQAKSAIRERNKKLIEEQQDKFDVMKSILHQKLAVLNKE
jgi:hypothetical protein